MTEKCCPRFKKIEASILRYKKSGNVRSKEDGESAQETEQFEGRVTNLKSKLDEANTNIAMLRAFVSQADIDLEEESKPQSPKKPKCEKLKDLIEELKELIVKLNEHQHQATVVTDRCLLAAKVFDEVENQKCFCALVTESCEKIKNELADLMTVKEELDETIDGLLNPKDEESPPPVNDMLEEVKTGIQEIRACTIISCPKLRNSAIQSASGAPSKLPRLVQGEGKSCCSSPCSPPQRATRNKGCGGCGG